MLLTQDNIKSNCYHKAAEVTSKYGK